MQTMNRTAANIERKNMEYKLCSCEIKEMNDAKYQFSGHISVKNNLDYGRDIVRNGAYRKSLADAFQRKAAGDAFLYPYLWNHFADTPPIGGIYDADETKTGMRAWVQLNPEISLARDVYSSLKMKTLSRQSVGYLATSVNWAKGEDGQSIRELLEMDVKEGSCCIFAMNPLARVEQIKRYWPGYSFEVASTAKGGRSMFARTKDFDSRYASEQLDDWRFADFQDVVSALRNAIDDCFTEAGDPLTNLENEVIPQLAAALRAYVQAGVDLGYDGSQQDSYGMMSMAGAGERKAGYINAAAHADAIAAVDNIMRHAKTAKRALASVSSARRYNESVSQPLYSASSSDYFEEKEDAEDINALIRTLTTQLALSNEMRENREQLESTMNPLDVSAARIRREQ